VSGPRVLVAGIGNIFFGDDAFGVEVVRRLASRPLPSNVKIVDFGIRGMHLAYEIVSGYDVVIFIDVVGSLGEEPGAIYVIEPTLVEPSGKVPDAHGMELENVFAFVRQLGGSHAKFLLVGCKPVDVREGMSLSPAVAAAVPAAVALVENLVYRHAKDIAGGVPAAQPEAIA
jgi:hydrogenase maturation protease